RHQRRERRLDRPHARAEPTRGELRGDRAAGDLALGALHAAQLLGRRLVDEHRDTRGAAELVAAHGEVARGRIAGEIEPHRPTLYAKEAPSVSLVVLEEVTLFYADRMIFDAV